MLINEIFGPTVQGEGKYIGSEVIFLRLAICNLACIWCDTSYTWNWEESGFLHPKKHNREKEIHTVSYRDVVNRIMMINPNVRRLVISGGEPMLQEREVVELLKILKKEDYWIELETNGTIIPSQEFFDLIDQINCSPKTNNSGPDNIILQKENFNALKAYAGNDKTIFKFVVQDERDMSEILAMVSKYNMKEVYLMPKSSSISEYYSRYQMVRQLAEQHGFNFSPRLQMELYGGERGH